MIAPRPPVIALATLGCKVNQAETEILSRRFASAGFTLTSFDAAADVYVLNTCTVTHIADRKARQLLRQARRRNPLALVIATGCYATTDAEAMGRIPGLDLAVPNDQKAGLVALVTRQLASLTLEPVAPVAPAPAGRTRAMVKVQDGCDTFCAYCIVPFARGKPTSVSLDHVVTQVSCLAGEGYQEVVLTGVHLGLWGKDLPGRDQDLASLVRAILHETSIPRLRLSSIEPQDFTGGFLDLWSDRRLCRHLHLPLQSGCEATLRRMGRRYTAAEFANLVSQGRLALPGLAITTDIIAGLPGETEAEFEESLAFARGQRFARIHVFKFSPRYGTRAATMPGQTPEPAKRVRAQMLAALSDEGSRSFRQACVGATVEVLWEERVGTCQPGGSKAWAGLSDNYIRVLMPSDEALENRITRVRLTGLAGDGMTAELTFGGNPGEPSRGARSPG
jgi:threonylcarbamoyladenosine tRNA methylthiotransferase MtaB